MENPASRSEAASEGPPVDSSTDNKSKADSSPSAKHASSGKPRTELPKVPAHPFHGFKPPQMDPAAIGNKALELAETRAGRLGYFKPRSDRPAKPLFLNLIMENYYEGIFRTLRRCLERQIRLNAALLEDDIRDNSEHHGRILASGCVIMTYLKLRSIALLEPMYSQRFLKLPRAPNPFEIPAPYALAIQQLGIVKVSSEEVDSRAAPMMTVADASRFGLPHEVSWDPSAYALSVEYAKKIGIQFNTVALSVKVGTAWYTYREALEEGVYSLKCTMPEDNYTPETTVLRFLWSDNGVGGFANEILDFAEHRADVYGSMARNPGPGINVQSFFAIEEVPAPVWNIV